MFGTEEDGGRASVPVPRDQSLYGNGKFATGPPTHLDGAAACFSVQFNGGGGPKIILEYSDTGSWIILVFNSLSHSGNTGS